MAAAAAAAVSDEAYDADDEVDEKDEDKKEDDETEAMDSEERRHYNAFICSKIDETWVCSQTMSLSFRIIMSTSCYSNGSDSPHHRRCTDLHIFYYSVPSSSCTTDSPYRPTFQWAMPPKCPSCNVM